MKVQVPQPSGRTSLPADHLPARGRRTSSHFLSQACGCSRVLWNLKPACSPPPSPGYHCPGVFVLRGFAHTCAWMTVLVVFQGTFPGFAAGVGVVSSNPRSSSGQRATTRHCILVWTQRLKPVSCPHFTQGGGGQAKVSQGKGQLVTAGPRLQPWAGNAPHPVRIHRVADPASPAGGQLTCC